jgi:hypothetical protein
MHDNKLMTAKQYTSFTGHFISHADQAVRCQYNRSKETIDVTMVIDFGSKNQVVAL